MQTLANNFKKTVLLLAIAIGLTVPAFSGTAHAGLVDGAKGEACKGAALNDTRNTCGEQDAKSLGDTMNNVINLLSIVVGIVCVIMIIIGGIRFITSNGDSNNITSARNTVIYALVGLIVVAFAQIVVKFVISRINP